MINLVHHTSTKVWIRNTKNILILGNHISSFQLYFRNASDGSEDEEEDEDSDYGAMAEQLEGFLGDDADNDEESHERPEECI